MAVGKNIRREKKEKGKQYNLPSNNMAVWKNIKWGKGVGDGNFGKENQDFFKNGGLGRISSCRELDTPLLSLLAAEPLYE